MPAITPAQTIGPYSAFSLTPRERAKKYPWIEIAGENLAADDAIGERIRIEGCVSNAAGKPHLRTLLEFWQADSEGRYAHPRDGRTRPNSSFKGFGRAETDAAGCYVFETIKPGPVPGPGGRMQAPHILVAIHSPYLLTHLCSRIYFADESANADDPVLALVPADRRPTLFARKDGAAYHMNFVTQGDNETVFFEF